MLYFVPRTNIAKKTMVWIQLPSLLMEFWSMRRLLGYMKDARKQIKKDNFMDQVRKTGFARV